MKRIKNQLQRIFKNPIKGTILTFQTSIYLMNSKFMNLYFEYYPTLLFHLRRKQVEKNLIVSLTSFPKRINLVHRTIKSILMQSVLPEKIILWLTYEEFGKNPKLPTKLDKLKKHGLEIRLVEKNYRPHNKYFHATQYNVNYCIITFDDDVLYPKRTISRLIQAHHSTKDEKVIVCSQSRTIIFNEKGEPSPYINWLHTDAPSISKSNLQLGVYGVLYPPMSLIFDENEKLLFTEIVLNADDLWLKFLTLKKGYKVYNLAIKPNAFFTTSNSQSIALSSDNVTGGKNDYYFQSLCKYFKLDKNNFLDNNL